MTSSFAPKVKPIAPRMNRVLSTVVIIIGLIVAVIAFQAYPLRSTAYADSGTFDYVYVISPAYLYKGNQGVLALDKRNGNIWFFGKSNSLDVTYHDPVLITRLPLEKLNAAPH